MDACQLIRERLTELGFDQKALAAAAEVTESYVSQVLTRKKALPAPARSDIYRKMEDFLDLPRGRLSELAELQRTDALRRRLGPAPKPLNEGIRSFVLRTCLPATQPGVRLEFERDAFGALERLVTQKLLDAAQSVAKEELGSEHGILLLAGLTGRSFEGMQASILEFLEADVFGLSAEHRVAFLDPMIESWDIDLASFGMAIVMNRRLGPGHSRRFELAEADGVPPEDEPGLEEFLRDISLSGDATDAEIAFLRGLRLHRKRPTPLYYYRELQNLRDPLHFREGAAE